MFGKIFLFHPVTFMPALLFRSCLWVVRWKRLQPCENSENSSFLQILMGLVVHHYINSAICFMNEMLRWSRWWVGRMLQHVFSQRKNGAALYTLVIHCVKLWPSFLPLWGLLHDTLLYIHEIKGRWKGNELPDWIPYQHCSQRFWHLLSVVLLVCRLCRSSAWPQVRMVCTFWLYWVKVQLIHCFIRFSQ